MEIIKHKELSKEELRLINKAKTIAEKTVSDFGHKVGCVIKCQNGQEFSGATNVRTRTIGSTCAERMALDQMFFYANHKPETCVLIGKFPNVNWRKKWSNDKICTPCGTCLETFRQVVESLRLKDLKFLCSSWNKKRVLRIKLSELFPLID